ncbi:MAG: hypothetical protein IJY18_01765 [Clostridia bacterium]|nr:hypothetical protein [Clostridia bacterium]
MKRKVVVITLIALLLLSLSVTLIFAADDTVASASFTPGCSEKNYTIPEGYADAEIIVFNKDGTVYNTSTSLIDKNNSSPKSALQLARGLVASVENAEAPGVVTILLRKNITVSNKFDNEGQVLGDIVFDLNGYTVTAETTMMNAQAKICDSSVRDSSFTWKNGTIEVGDSGLWCVGAYGATYVSDKNSYKTMNYIFDNVKLSLTEGNTAPSLIGSYMDNTNVGRVDKADIDDPLKNSNAHLQYMGLNVKFLENCVIDLSNASEDFTLFNACDPLITDTRYSTSYSVTDSETGEKVTVEAYRYNTNSITTVTVEGGRIIAPKVKTAWSAVNSENGSFVHFEKGASSGKYTVFSASESSVFDDSSVFASESGLLCAMMFGKGEYTLFPMSFVDNASVVPKSSITLDSNLILNVYIPNKSYLNKIEIDGKTYTDFSALTVKTVDGEEHFFFSFPFSSNEAARAVPLSVTVSGEGLSAKRNFDLSIPSYAALLMESGKASANEKVLVADILSYIKAAYAYFDSEDSEAIAAIDGVLDPDHEKMSPVKIEGSTDAPSEGLTDVRFILAATPALRFYIEDEADESLYTFKSGNITLPIKSGRDTDGRYLEVDVYAYALADQIDYFLGGENKGSYHINSYYNFITNAPEYKDDSELCELLLRFWKYCQSARAYRGEKLGIEAYAHEHSYYERSFEMSANNPEYSEKICACGESEKTLGTGLDMGDKPIKVLFLGNSYTSYNDLKNIFAAIADSMGISVEVSSVTKGGWQLYKYQNPADSGGELFYDAIEADDYDYVFLQDRSTQTIDELEKFYEGVRLCGKIAENDGAKVILYQTWGRKEGHAVLDESGYTPETMAYRVAASYEAIAKETGYTNSPAGSAFLDVYKNHPEIDVYNADLSHPSPIGSYLAALCHYATLFGRSPIGVKYTAGIEDESVVAVLQKAAYDAVFGESIVPDEFKTSSEGIGVKQSSANLSAIPEGAELISVGITGDREIASSSVTKAKDETLTEDEMKDLADISYGVSIIGAKNMINAASAAADGAWKGTRLSFDFTGEHYDVTGFVNDGESAVALITYNFGKVVNLKALGYMSGDLNGFPQAQDVYISNDGISWAAVTSASYDRTAGEEIASITDLPLDSSSNTPGVCAVFDMNSESGGVYAKYVRIAILKGVQISNKKYDVNTLELAFWGSDHNVNLSDIPEGSELISVGMTASAEYSATGLSDAQKSDLKDMTKYDFTAIGFETAERSISGACNGSWSDKKRLSVTFDENKYDIEGNIAEDGAYEALLTYNFGEKVTLDAIGYMSGNLGGIAQAHDVYISNDGVNWIKVGTACQNRAGGDTVKDVTNKPLDSSGAAASACAMFDMGGVTAQYVRVGVITGLTVTSDYDINTYEIAVYGKKN